MEFITDILKLEGKTIKNAVSVDANESIVLIFTDGTCAFFDVEFYGESHDIILINNPYDYLKRDAGIITQARYEVLCQYKEKAE